MNIKVNINGKEYELLYLKSDSEKEEGLKNVESMSDTEGAFFDYRDDPQEEISFWMQGTSIPLDIIFVNEEDTVSSVKKGEPLSEDFLTDYNISYVIELNQNSGVKEGDYVEILDENDSVYSDLPKNEMLVLNSDGTVQFRLLGGERIMSRIFSRKLIKLCKRAFKSNDDKDFKKLGKAMFKELSAQESRPNEYVESPN